MLSRQRYFAYSSALLAAIALFTAPASAQLLGPLPGPDTPYLSFNDSPFNGVTFSYFHLEDFEDALFNTPGVTADNGGVTSVVFGPNIHDSVDADDGNLDGSGLDGDTFFGNSVTFTFDAGVLGLLPTHAGMVWTDGGNPTFEAFDALGFSMGTVTGVHADGSINGETGEDRFYGAINAGGISAIRFTSGTIELDHLQYGRAEVNAAAPEPASLTLGLLGMIAAVMARRKRTQR